MVEAFRATCQTVCHCATIGAGNVMTSVMEEGEGVTEYLIKWKGKSYMHSSWHTGTYIHTVHVTSVPANLALQFIILPETHFML